jgi:hypothetical protein
MPADVRLGLRTAVAFPFASNPGEKERLAGSPPEPATGLLVLRSGSAKAVAGTMQRWALLAIDGLQ